MRAAGAGADGCVSVGAESIGVDSPLILAIITEWDSRIRIAIWI